MIVDVSRKILIVGLGLLGGSYARSLKRFGFHVSAVTLDQSSVDYALNEGIIDEGSAFLDEKLIGEADLVIFALYPHVFVEWIEKNQHLLKSGALITDVTGVKRKSSEMTLSLSRRTLWRDARYRELKTARTRCSSVRTTS